MGGLYRYTPPPREHRCKCSQLCATVATTPGDTHQLAAKIGNETRQGTDPATDSSRSSISELETALDLRFEAIQRSHRDDTALFECMALHQEALEDRLDRLLASHPGKGLERVEADDIQVSYSLALGVKMNILLFLPGLLVLLFQYQGIAHGAICGGLVLAVQVCLVNQLVIVRHIPAGTPTD